MRSHYQSKRGKNKPEIHPLWRGIGFILMVLDLLVSFALTTIVVPLLVATGYVPLGLLGYVHFPRWIFRLPLLGSLATFIGSITNLAVGLIVFFVIMLLLTGIFMLVYVWILQVIGPPRYSEVDAPSSKHKAKVYKR